MPKYKIKVKFEIEIRAKDEEEAIKTFWNDTVYDIQSEPASFIDDNLTIKQIK